MKTFGWLEMGSKRSFLILNEGQKLMFISDITWFKIDLFWFLEIDLEMD